MTDSKESKTNNELCRLLPNNILLTHRNGNIYRFIELIEVNYGGYAIHPAAMFRDVNSGEVIYYGLELTDIEFKIKETLEELLSNPLIKLTAVQKALILNYEHNLTLKPKCETNYPPEDTRMIKKV